jgi:hypothetical protein
VEKEMKSICAVLIALAGLAFAALPAAAQTEITVFGGQVDFFDDAPGPSYNGDFVAGPRFDPGGNFDPAAAAINALNASHFYLPRGRSMFNLDRAMTLNRTGESLAEHQLICLAAYDNYDLASDTYIGPDGVPRPCRL